VYCTLPTSVFDISDHPLVREADILHLHWINKFVDYPSFFKKVQKTTIWTLHDENLFYGIAHYSQHRIAGEALETKYYEIKLKAVRQIKNLGIVFLSKWMQQQFAGHEMIRGRFSTVISNAVDCREFHPVDKKRARAMFGIDENAIVFVFVSVALSDARKGLGILAATLAKMKIPRAMILAVGANEECARWPLVKSVGPIYDTERLSAAYSCGNYFVMPSQQEAFAQTPMEALACGVPVIAFPVSGTGELITETNGVRCKGFASADLEEGIRRAMNVTYDATAIRKDMMERFSPERIARKYLNLYNRLRSRSE